MGISGRGRPGLPERRQGFSLIEILVAATVLVLLTSVLSSLALQTRKIWSGVDGQTQRRSTGRSLLQFIARDLEMAALPSGYPASATAAANLQFVANLSSNPANATAIPSDFLNPHAAFWQAPVSSDRQQGALAEVGYFIRWDTSQPGVAKAQLCRFQAIPSDAANFLIYGDSTGAAVNWLAPGILSAVAPASASTNYKGWIADNVIALWIRCLNSQGQPIVATASGTTLNGGYGFDSRQGFTDPAGTRQHPAPALPPVVEITLVTVDARTALRIAAPLRAVADSPANFGKDRGTPGSLAYFLDQLPAPVKPGVEVFSTRVFLKNAGPE